LDPQNFWLALPILAVVWFVCESSSSRLNKVIAKTLKPWLVGMLITGVCYLAVNAWLPQARWSWIFDTEIALSRIELTLAKVLPENIFLNIGLLERIPVILHIRRERRSWHRL